MPKISRVEVFQVDLMPKVLRSDAIQAFSKQETPMVRIWTDDGMDVDVGLGISWDWKTIERMRVGHAIIS
jgi:hypothetical protein